MGLLLAKNSSRSKFLRKSFKKSQFRLQSGISGNSPRLLVMLRAWGHLERRKILFWRHEKIRAVWSSEEENSILGIAAPCKEILHQQLVVFIQPLDVKLRQILDQSPRDLHVHVIFICGHEKELQMLTNDGGRRKFTC